MKISSELSEKFPPRPDLYHIYRIPIQALCVFSEKGSESESERERESESESESE